MGLCDFNYFLGKSKNLTFTYGRTVGLEESSNLWQFVGGKWEEFPEWLK